MSTKQITLSAVRHRWLIRMLFAVSVPLRAAVSKFNVIAVVLAMFIGVVGSIVALLCVVILSQVTQPLHHLWFVGLVLVLAFSAMGAFVVARVAGRRSELPHAFIAALPFVAMSYWVYPGSEFKNVMPGGIAPGLVPPTPTWHDTVVYALILSTIPTALLGGYIARARKSRFHALFLSRLTYCAMALLGTTEAVDSFVTLNRWFPTYLGIAAISTLMLAIVGSIGLMVCGPWLERRRAATWYALWLLVGSSASFGWTARLTTETAAATLPALWLVRGFIASRTSTGAISLRGRGCQGAS